MAQRLFCLILFFTTCTSLQAQHNYDLVLVEQHNKHNTERLVIDDVVTIRTGKGGEKYAHCEITEISDTAIVLNYRDTVLIAAITSITGKSLGQAYYKTGILMVLAGTGSAGVFFALSYVGSNLAFAGQLLAMGFTAFAIPFGIANIVLGKIKNSKMYRMNDEEWRLEVQQRVRLR